MKHTGEKFPLPFSTNQEKKKEPEQKNYILLEGPGRTLSVKEDGLRFWPSVPGHNRGTEVPAAGRVPEAPVGCDFPSEGLCSATSRLSTLGGTRNIKNQGHVSRLAEGVAGLGE